MRAQRDRDRRVDPRELLDHQRICQRVPARSPVLLGERDAHQVELAEAADDRVRERMRAVELLGHRRDLLLGKLADGVPQQAVLIG